MTDQKNDWDACPQGEIRRMVDSLEAKQRKQVWFRFAGAATAVVLVVVGIIVFSPAEATADMKCPECKTLMADFHEGTLDDDTADRVAHHMDECPSCRDHFERNYGNRNGNTSQADGERSVASLAR